MNTHPFEITEIIEHIAENLDILDLLSCLRVCRTLYEAIVPSVWRVINLRAVTGATKYRYPTGGSLERYKNHIQEIHFLGLCPSEFLKIQGCHRLHTLTFQMSSTFDFDSGWLVPASTLFVKFVTTYSSTLRSIKIQAKVPSSSNLWNVLAGCPNLIDLDLTGHTVTEGDWPLLLQLWGRLRSLSFSRVTIAPRPESAYEVACNPGTDVNVSGGGSGGVNLRGPRELSLEGSNFRNSLVASDGAADLVALIRRNHKLESLRWRWTASRGLSGPFNDACRVFFQALSNSPWSLTALQSLDLQGAFVSDEILASILYQVYHLKTLKASRTKFGPLCFNALIGEGNALALEESLGTTLSQPRRLCKSVETLYIDSCQHVTGAMIQRLLASCPNLKYFAADKITVREIAWAQHWACKEMRHLEIYLSADDGNDEMNENYETTPPEFMKMQRHTFEKLNTLTKLQKLVLTNGVGEYGQRRKKTLDLRVRAGLGLLRGLKELREFSFQSEIPQMMNTEEALWIADHWPRIKCIEGPWNQDAEAYRMMMAIVCPTQPSISKRE
ncbi:hypothetical protein BGX26_004380 [Mortierella sp. AD094]|nr:hypothetical protein BGX26_004380 [Mortierella sp. AD094]